MPKARPWYRIENAASDEAEVFIYGDIGASWFGDGVEAKQFAEDLAGVDAKTVRIRINSGGGSVFEGVAIAAAIERHPAKTIAHIDGLAASAASRIALAADEVRMAKDAFFMIHNARGVGMGEAKDLRDTADLLEKINGSIRDTYVRKTGEEAAQVAAWMDAETWFTADEAREAGFVDAIDEKKAARAQFDPALFNRVPDALLERMKEPRRLESARDVEDLLVENGATREMAKSIAARGWKTKDEPREAASAEQDPGSEPREEAEAETSAAIERLLSTLRS